MVLRVGRLKELEIDVSVEWSIESSDAIRETVEGMLQACCNSLILEGAGNLGLGASINSISHFSYSIEVEVSALCRGQSWNDVGNGKQRQETFHVDSTRARAVVADS
ncbi:hypothetical protein SASPL_145066 [Salvia splendens]|uniref:Uncharacterized protein n=1 Tax=Salvia splendens TaxID=180675 RepID=A0A8X8WGV7_SALSN|nr:hypothetical protein SASPL_145066 [Salvia splendens]